MLHHKSEESRSQDPHHGFVIIVDLQTTDLVVGFYLRSQKDYFGPVVADNNQLVDFSSCKRTKYLLIINTLIKNTTILCGITTWLGLM